MTKTHTHTNGTIHHNHSHTHDPKEIKAIVNRISRASGHLNSIKTMVENGQDCSDVLVQLAAVKGELNKIGKVLLQEHIEHCIVEAAAEGDMEEIEKMNKAIDQFMK
jgi:DNA-binding FrmR family transcriptional regulator